MYENPQYCIDVVTKETVCIRVSINGVISLVPLDEQNRDYTAIMKLVEEGKLTIQPADNINNQNS